MKAKIEIDIGEDSTLDDLLKYLDYLQETFYTDEAATGYPAWKIRLLEPPMNDNSLAWQIRKHKQDSREEEQ